MTPKQIKWKTTSITINLIGCDTVVNSPSIVYIYVLQKKIWIIQLGWAMKRTVKDKNQQGQRLLPPRVKSSYDKSEHFTCDFVKRWPRLVSSNQNVECCLACLVSKKSSAPRPTSAVLIIWAVPSYGALAAACGMPARARASHPQQGMLADMFYAALGYTLHNVLGST